MNVLGEKIGSDLGKNGMVLNCCCKPTDWWHGSARELISESEVRKEMRKRE